MQIVNRYLKNSYVLLVLSCNKYVYIQTKTLSAYTHIFFVGGGGLVCMYV